MSLPFAQIFARHCRRVISCEDHLANAVLFVLSLRRGFDPHARREYLKKFVHVCRRRKQEEPTMNRSIAIKHDREVGMIP